MAEGLSTEEAKKRLQQYGPNAIEEKKTSTFVSFFKYFWGPIPIMIEIAAILSLIIGNYTDFVIILILLLVNGLVDFWEEFQAGNAIAALKQKLALQCQVKRDGKWQTLSAKELVPGDVIHIEIGNIIPADATLVEGDFLTVDQSALTGESLPQTKKKQEKVFSGSIAKQGNMIAEVTETGKNTFFGKTAQLVEKAHPTSHFQKAVLRIGNFLIYISLVLACLLLVIQLIREEPILEVIHFVFVLIIASIPVAMPAVLSVTMALGALKLSRMKAVVARLESIEEMAGVDVLCSDKTGTLTQNALTLGTAFFIKPFQEQDVILYGALASQVETKDPIDLAIVSHAKSDDLKKFKQTHFTPFDPVSKKTQSTILDESGKTIYVSKGAPQVILALCQTDQNSVKEIKNTIDSFGKKGYRTLGVAKSEDGKTWQFIGLLPLFDPLRPDSLETIQHAREHGIEIKMLTGDNIAVAKQIASELQLGENILVAQEQLSVDMIDKANGFAQVFPEHKFDIVKALQGSEHIVGMTGDGVNDAPALKEADVGIAVSGATDAARASAALVLLEAGLSVIIKAIDEARRIFERMNSYAIYRIAETIRVMSFIFLSIVIFSFYPVTARMIIFLALLNDLPIMAIVYDRTIVNQKPVRWQMRSVLTIASVLGFVGILASFSLLVIAKEVFKLNLQQLQSLIFLKLSVAGHLTLFLARTKNAFFSKPYPSPILLTAILATQFLAAILVGFGWFLPQLPWKYIGLLWLYALLWMGITDVVKVFTYRHFLCRTKSK